MRIHKAQAITVLSSENALLGKQMELCRRQAAKLSGTTLVGMCGNGAARLQEMCRMHAAVVESHLVFYDSLRRANQHNMDLIQALPETSSGVLDTAVAAQRLADASERIKVLRDQMEESLQEARRTNDEIRSLLVLASPQSVVTAPPAIDSSAIRMRFQSLIECEQLIERVNKKALDEAKAYDLASANIYGSVSVASLRNAGISCNTYVRTGNWGNISWVGSMRTSALFQRRAQRSPVHAAPHPKENGAVAAFLHGDMEQKWTAATIGASGKLPLGDVLAGGAVSGSAMGVSLSVKPFGKRSDEEGNKQKKSATFGAKAQAEVYGLQGKAAGDLGFAHANAKVTLASGSVSGTLGASLYKDGEMAPELEVGAQAKATGVKGDAELMLGNKHYNLAGKAEGKLLAAETKAKLGIGAQGIEAKVGAEAYAATGELAAGFTVLGLRVEASVEGKLGGGGAQVAGSANPSSIQGEIGAGLGLGAGVKVKVDWSGVSEALEDARMGADDWWVDLR